MVAVATMLYAQQEPTTSPSLESSWQTKNQKVITRSTMVALGHTNILDTYISQEKYSGTELRFVSHSIVKREDSRWSRLIIHQGFVSMATTRANKGNEMEGMYNFQYGYLYNWQLCQHRLSVIAGATADASIGGLYNTHSGNNPAQAQLKFAITPTASAAYSLSLGKIPLKATYEIGVPLLGLMFSPNYGQSYYEIFNRGNYDHNIIITTPFNSPSMRQMLAIDATLKRTTLRIGYLGDIRQANVNNLKSHIYTHAFMIGVTRKFSILHL